jgi:hypothetical protein
MAKIKIDDLSRLEDLSPEEAKGIFGGATPLLHPQTGHLADPIPTEDLLPQSPKIVDKKADSSDKKKGTKKP